MTPSGFRTFFVILGLCLIGFGMFRLATATRDDHARMAADLFIIAVSVIFTVSWYKIGGGDNR